MGGRAESNLVTAAQELLALAPGRDLLQRWSEIRSNTDTPFAALQALVLQLLRERPTLATAVVERVIAGRAVDDPLEQLRLIRLHAHTAKATGDLPIALDRYGAAAAGFAQHDDQREIARTVIGWADALALAGELEPALALLENARAAVAHLDPTAAARLEGTAATVHYLAGQFARAEQLYRAAHRRARRQHQWVDVAVCAFNLGNVELLRGRAAHARTHYAKARTLFEEAGLELAVLQCRYGVAAARLHRGEWAPALSEFDRVCTDLRERGDRRGAAAIDHDAAELLSSLGADHAAEVHVRRARADFAAMGLGPERARSAALHARVLARLGRTHDAQRRLQEASAGFERMGRTDLLDRLDLERLGLTLHTASPSTLRSDLERLARRAARRDDPTGAIRVRILRAELALREGREESALRLAMRAHADARHPALRAARPHLALLVARAHARSGRSALAVQWARRAVRELERSIRRFADRAEGLGLGRARETLAIGAIEIVLDHGGSQGAREALRMLMAVRAGSVVDDLLRGRHRALREDLRAALARLRDRLMESGEAPGDIRSTALRGEIHRLESELRGSARPRALPGSIVIERGGPSQWLRRSGARPLVLYDRKGARWGAFVVGARATVRYVELPEVAVAMRESWIPLRMMFEALASSPAPSRERLLARTTDEARAALRHLHAALWAPLELAAPEVVVVSSGALNGVALEAALVESLGESAPVVARVPHPDLLLGTTPRRLRHAMLVAGTVPGAQSEIDHIGERLQRAGWTTRVENSREGFLRSSRRCGVVHLAAHGSFHRSRWISNGLRLSDGWLGFEQLDPRRVAGALLYFDSCESGLAGESPGAELDGWANAGFAAGAHEVVLNLWKVDDRSATRFATSFYDAWCAGRTTALAAHEARQHARVRAEHPFEWAAGIVSSRRPFAHPPR